jgi:hypothetical protein
MSAIFGAVALLILFCLFLVVIWRLCNAKSACAAQRREMPYYDSDADLPRYVITQSSSSSAVLCNEHGMFRLNERGEWVPFEGGH